MITPGRRRLRPLAAPPQVALLAVTLDAADVAASINHHRGEESKSAAKPIVDPITDIKVDGKVKHLEDAVCVYFKAPSAERNGGRGALEREALCLLERVEAGGKGKSKEV